MNHSSRSFLYEELDNLLLSVFRSFEEQTGAPIGNKIDEIARNVFLAEDSLDSVGVPGSAGLQEMIEMSLFLLLLPVHRLPQYRHALSVVRLVCQV